MKEIGSSPRTRRWVRNFSWRVFFHCDAGDWHRIDLWHQTVEGKVIACMAFGGNKDLWLRTGVIEQMLQVD